MVGEIAHNIRDVRAHIPAGVTLVCVSKFQSEQAILEAYEAGERHFGESRVQELLRKKDLLPADIHWHFIGHLQTNKVRDLLKARPCLIQSIDSLRLLKAVNDEAAGQGFIQDVLLEVHVAKEQTKTGFTPEEINDLMVNDQMVHYPNIRVRGLMAMATNTDDEQEIRRCFTMVKSLNDQINAQMVNAQMVNDLYLSMGMSDDYRIAIECGATMVRIGSTIFGERSLSGEAGLSAKRSNSASGLTAKRSLKAVFFDQDGVLYNSMPYHAEAWAWAMTMHGLPYTAEETYKNEGRTSVGVIQEYHMRIFGTPATQELIDTIYADKTAYFNRMTGGFPGIIPNVDKVLKYLNGQGIECWVVTGSGQRNLINALNETFDNVFKGIISSFDVKKGKPDPEPYLKAWERSGFKKEECMVVENAPLGVRAAKAAGLFTVAVNTGPLPDELLWDEKADVVLPDMEALLQFLKNR